MTIPQDFIDQVREQVSIAEYVGEIVSLKRVGKNLSGLCPFHSEKSPSFFVNDEDGFFNCFGCGKKGSVFDFVMETRGLSFPESVRMIGKRAGLEVPESEQRGESEELRQKKAMLRDVLRLTSEHYHQTLLHSPAAEPARAYLSRRKVTGQLIERFHLGFAPESETLLAAIAPKFCQLYPQFQDGTSNPSTSSQKREEMLQIFHQAGVYNIKTYAGSDGQPPRKSAYETFRGRVIFPIAKSEGTCIGFGGRILVDHPQRPKYLNSSESLLYLKSKTLFGLSQAMEGIRKERELFLVEGYMDVVAFHGSGLTNAVACCGTSVTPEHVKVMKRLVDRVIVVFDGDSAGLRAAAHAFQVFLNSGIEVFGVTLPTGEDPGSLYESGRAETLRDLVQNQREQIVDVFIAHRLSQNLSTAQTAGEAASVGSPVQLGRVAKEIAKLLGKVENPVELESLKRRVAEKIGVSLDAFEQLVRTGAEQKRSPRGLSATQGFSDLSSPEFDGPPPYDDDDRFGFIGANEGFSAEDPRVAGRGSHTIPGRIPRLSMIDQYCFQILVTVVSEPGLARTLLDMPSLMGKSPVVSVLPENVRRCLEIFASESVLGLASLRDVAPDIRANGLARLRGILEMEQIDAEPIFVEGARQMMVGGTQRLKLLTDMPEAHARLTLKDEVTTIREQELGVKDADDIVRLAQEKLKKRRDLERLAKISS